MAQSANHFLGHCHSKTLTFNWTFWWKIMCIWTRLIIPESQQNTPTKRKWEWKTDLNRPSGGSVPHVKQPALTRNSVFDLNLQKTHSRWQNRLTKFIPHFLQKLIASPVVSMWSMSTAPTPWCIPSFQGADSTFDITFLFIFQTPVAHCDRSHFTYWAQTLFYFGLELSINCKCLSLITWKDLVSRVMLCRPGCTASPLSIMKKMFLIEWCTESDLKIQRCILMG